MCVCVQWRPLFARRLDSVHLQRQRGQKRHPFLLSGQGAIDTNKSPLPLPPWCVGVMSGMSQVLLSPRALFLVTHHQAFSAVHSATSLPLRDQQHTCMSTPFGLLCPLVPNPEQTTSAEYDRQTDRRQDIRFGGPSLAQLPSGGKKSQLFIFTCLVASSSLSNGRTKIKQWPKCFKIHS